MRNLFIVVAAVVAASSFAGAQDTPPPNPALNPAPRQAPAGADDMAAGNAAFQKEDWPAAVKAYESALAKGLTTRIINFRLGYALHMLKRYEEALKHHMLAVALTNRNLRIDALYNVSCAYALLGRKDESLKYLQYAIDAGFSDTGQIEKDTDMDPLRDDDRFKKLVAGIGKTPRLDQQMDFFLGTWTSKDDKGEVTQTLTLTRPLSESAAITSKNTNVGGGAFGGMLYPNAADRMWTWISVDGFGTTTTYVGKAIEKGMRFEGRESSIGGQGALVRLTYTPSADGVMEKAEVSDDGKTWRVHHEEKYTKTAPHERPQAERPPP